MTNSIIKTDKIRVLAESMVELRQSLLYLIEANDPHGLTKNDHDEIVAIVIAAIEGSLQTIELNQAEDVLGRMVERVEALGSAIFRDVNSPSKTNTIFDTAVRAANAPLRDGRSIHLELGTYSVWPDERADRYVRDEKIGDVIRLDMSLDYPVDVGASVTAMPFADESIDRIYSNSLFEHCAYPHEIIREAFRILRPGGVFLTAVPFHFVQHGCPRDYLRFTGDFFEDV
jgi:SAM-dependent methyltransferase